MHYCVYSFRQYWSFHHGPGPGATEVRGDSLWLIQFSSMPKWPAGILLSVCYRWKDSYQSHCLRIVDMSRIGSADPYLLIPWFSVQVPRLATWMSKCKSSHLAELLSDNRSLFQSNARDSSVFLFHIRARQQRWSSSLRATGCYRNSIQILPLGFLIVSSTHTHAHWHTHRNDAVT